MEGTTMNIRRCKCDWISDVTGKEKHKCDGCGKMQDVDSMSPVPSNCKNKIRVELNQMIMEACDELYDDVSNGRIRLSTE
jgi:hypothetical protein